MKGYIIVIFLMILAVAAPAQFNRKGFQVVPQPGKKQVNIVYNGNILTAYCYFDSIRKPFLYPVKTVDGITVTRGYPIQPVVGERTDHPHHTGLWLNYESVNGLDFWNNSTAIAPQKRSHYGTIRHQEITDYNAGPLRASLSVTADWHRPDNKVLLAEKTNFVFSVQGKHFLIDRITTLTAMDDEVIFKDVKDGFLAIRVARELEMPTQQADIFVDAAGNETAVPKINNEGVTGMYYSSEGLKGDSVWGSKGRWAMLKGKKEGKNIAIAFFDHPSNPGYPTYWHARGYGLFALNPLGRKIFSNGKEELNFSLQPHRSVTFRYRVMIASDAALSANQINKIADAFANTK